MFEEYLKELSKVDILSEEREKLLWERYKKYGDLNSRAELIESYQPFVFKLVMKMQSRSDIILDLIQEATLGLIEAVERYDYKKGVNFATYASFRIRGQIINFLHRYNIDTLSLDQVVSLDEDEGVTLLELLHNPEQEDLFSLEDSSYQSIMQDAISRLPEKEKIVIKGIFYENKKPENLAQELKISLAHIYRLQKKAIRRIRGMLSRIRYHHKKDTQI